MAELLNKYGSSGFNTTSVDDSININDINTNETTSSTSAEVIYYEKFEAHFN